MESPRVSIITPTYNHEHFIGACIESVRSQTFTNWEMIIVDDGSTDCTWQVIQTYCVLDPRIKAFRQENKGIWRLSETYNYALGQAHGDLIAILEGDDYWPAEKLDIQIPYHDQHNLLLSHGRTVIVKDKKILGEYCHPAPGILSSIEYLQMAFLNQSCIMPVSVIINKASLDQIGGFQQDEGFPAVDFPTWVRLFELPGYIIWSKHCLGFWRQSSGQMTQQNGLVLAEIGLQISRKRYDQLSPYLKSQLSITEKDIIKTRYLISLNPTYLIQARKALVDRNKEQALYYSRKLILHGSVKRKMQGFFAFFAAFFGTDIEFLFKGYEKMGYFLKNRSFKKSS